MKTKQWLPLLAITMLFSGSSCSEWGHVDPPAGNQTIPTLQNVGTYAFEDEILDPSVFSLQTYDGGNVPVLSEATEEYGSRHLSLDGWKRRVRLTPSGTRDLTPRAK